MIQEPKKQSFHKKSLLKDQKGAALLVALFAVLLLFFLATEIAQETISEYLVASKEVKRVQAYYAAEACTNLTLLKVKLYQQAVSALGNSLPDPSLLEQVWQFPLMWPIVTPEKSSTVDKEEIKDAMTESIFKGQYLSVIAPEESRIDVNDLASPAKAIKDATKKQLLDLFTTRLAEEDEWAEKHRSVNFEELVNNIADWIDVDQESGNGGAERSLYSSIDNQNVPPNQAFKSVEELHLVAGMTDDIYDVLKERITIFGVKGININYVDKPTLMSLDPTITAEKADLIIQRRQSKEQGGPFQDLGQFTSYAQGIGVNVTNFAEGKIPLLFEAVMNFRIECTGTSGDVARKIIAITYDFDTVKERLTKFVKAQQPQGAEQQCESETGEEKFACLCRGQPDEQACIVQKRNEAGAGTDQADNNAGQNSDEKPKRPMPPPGPPNVVHWSVQ